jgi:hypothetical protein
MLAEVAWSQDESPLAFVCGPTPFVEGVAARYVVDLRGTKYLAAAQS